MSSSLRPRLVLLLQAAPTLATTMNWIAAVLIPIRGLGSTLLATPVILPAN